MDTPDCTSIDTSIPEEELLENRVRQKAVDYDLGSIDRMALKEEDEDGEDAPEAAIEVAEGAEDDAQDDRQESQKYQRGFTLVFLT